MHIPTDLLARLVPNRARIIVENFQFHLIAAWQAMGSQLTAQLAGLDL